MPSITPFLWFTAEAEEAAAFYVSIFPNSKVTDVSRYGEAGPEPAGTAMVVELNSTASRSWRSTRRRVIPTCRPRTFTREDRTLHQLQNSNRGRRALGKAF